MLNTLEFFTCALYVNIQYIHEQLPPKPQVQQLLTELPLLDAGGGVGVWKIGASAAWSGDFGSFNCSLAGVQGNDFIAFLNASEIIIWGFENAWN